MARGDVQGKPHLRGKYTAKAKVSFITLLKQSGARRKLSQVKHLHKRITKCGLLRDKVLSSLLIYAYGQCGAPDRARALFDSLENLNCHSWNFMIRIHALHDQHPQALALFKLMQKLGFPQDRYTFTSALAACTSPASLPHGKRIHRAVLRQELESDIVVGTSLINMYGKCGRLDRACDVFDRILDRNAIAWTIMINAYTQHDYHMEAIQLFHQMHLEGILATLITCVSVLVACSSLRNITRGKHMHLYMTCNSFELNTKAHNAIINMYAKCGNIDIAHDLFREVPEPNVITWTSIISAFSQHGKGKEALHMFHEMQKREVLPSRVTFVSMLDACAMLADLFVGYLMHMLVIDMAFDDEIVIGTALVSLYGKCGQLDSARMIFRKMREKNLLTWTAMIGAYAQHGHGKKALLLFNRLRSTGLKPDKVTFVHILSACSRSGLVEEGRQFFSMMQDEFSIEPTVDHYSCMIDILGRAGLLDEAESYLNNMPKELGIVPWRTILGAWKVQGHLQAGDVKGRDSRISDLDPSNSAPDTAFPDIYTSG